MLNVLAGVVIGCLSNVAVSYAGAIAGKVAEGFGQNKKNGQLIGAAGSGAWVVSLVQGDSYRVISYRLGFLPGVVILSAAFGAGIQGVTDANVPARKERHAKALLCGLVALAGSYVLPLPLATFAASVVAHVVARTGITAPAAQPAVVAAAPVAQKDT